MFSCVLLSSNFKSAEFDNVKPPSNKLSPLHTGEQMSRDRSSSVSLIISTLLYKFRLNFAASCLPAV